MNSTSQLKHQATEEVTGVLNESRRLLGMLKSGAAVDEGEMDSLMHDFDSAMGTLDVLVLLKDA